MKPEMPEYLRGPLAFYWVDTGSACGLVVLNEDVDAIVECAPFWRRWFVGRTLEEIVEENPDVRIRRLKGAEAPRSWELGPKLGRWKRRR